MRFSDAKREHFKQFICQQIKNGRYAIPNKVVQETLRELEEIVGTPTPRKERDNLLQP